MPDVDFKFTYHGFNREDGQYDLHLWNQPIEVFFSRKIWTYEFQQLIFYPVATRVDNCEEMSVIRKRLSVQFCCNLYVRLCGALDPHAGGRGIDARLSDQFHFFRYDRAFSDNVRLGRVSK